MFHFNSAFPICSSRFLLQSWMLGLLLICARFDNVFFLVAQNGNTKGSFLFFSVVIEIYEHYEPPCAISLFQMNKLFSHHFRGFKLEYPIPGILAIQFVFPRFLTIQFVFPHFLTRTQMTDNSIRSYVHNRVIFMRTNLYSDYTQNANKLISRR